MRRMAFTGLVAAMMALTMISCNKTTNVKPSSSEKVDATISTDTEICKSETVNLIAAQNMNSETVGTVTVKNDAETLSVTYTTTGDWMIECIHLYVGSLDSAPTNGLGNPVIGQFPIHQCFNPVLGTVTYKIPLSSLGSSFIVAAQAEVSQEIDGVVTRQTAWIDGTSFSDRGNWATYYEYTPGTCQTASSSETSDSEDSCYENAVAWVDGESYVGGANCWCTYVAYSAGDTASIIANKNMNAGYISFSSIYEVGSEKMITISIHLKDNWRLQNIPCSVKIEGYVEPPTTKPAARDFQTYRGNESDAEVPAFDYYGVHLNLQYEVPCK